MPTQLLRLKPTGPPYCPQLHRQISLSGQEARAWKEHGLWLHVCESQEQEMFLLGQGRGTDQRENEDASGGWKRSRLDLGAGFVGRLNQKKKTNYQF